MRFSLKTLGPGLLLAATGIGVGDLVGATIAGAEYGLALVWAIDRRLREKHTSTWEGLGLKRSGWVPPPADVQLRCLRYLYRREEESLNDERLNRLCQSFRWFYAAYVLLLLSGFVIFAMRFPGKAP